MKLVRKIVITYFVIMVLALGGMILFWQNMKLMTGEVASYSDEELFFYKKIWNNLNNNMIEGQNMMLRHLIIIWAVLFLLGIIMIVLVYILLVKPVKEMENFASEIAKGNLDVPLPIHKNNMFGSFTESFDLMREEMKISKTRELEAEKAKREMVAELSHDLKTPVATIRATCEVMEVKIQKDIDRLRTINPVEAGYEPLKNAVNAGDSNDLYTEEHIKELRGTLEKIGYIYNKAEMINELVGSVFRATLDDMQEIKVEPKENESILIESYFSSLKEYGNIILENHIPECLVYFDKLRMEQVIDNIVGNSYKYAGTDIYVLFDETEMFLPGNDKKNKASFIKIIIRDNGPGVSEDDLPLLTEKFHRGSNSDGKQGYGLGMYLANWYMEKQGGGMEYYNDGGFVVELLLRKV